MRAVIGTVCEMQSVKESAYEMQSAIGARIKMKCVIKASKE